MLYLDEYSVEKIKNKNMYEIIFWYIIIQFIIEEESLKDFFILKKMRFCYMRD